MPSKPTTALRRPPTTTSKPARTKAATAAAMPPSTDREVNRTLEHIGRQRERAPDEGEPLEHTGRGVVQMRGRLLADGSRKGARVARRITFYLDPELVDELEVRARKRGASLSAEAERALAESYGIVLEAAP